MRIFVLLSTFAALASTPALAASDPISLYGSDRLSYRIERDGTPVGRHVIRFTPGPDGLRVIAETEIAVRLLFFTAYRFTYRSDSLWRDGAMIALTARVDDDGTRRSVMARREGASLVLDSGVRAAARTKPTDHWHPGVLGDDSVLNTLTGRVNAVTIRNSGQAMVPAGTAKVPATRWRYDGKLSLDSWYDADGRWLGMRFDGRDGSTIRYICEVCGVSPHLSEAR